MGIVVGTTPTTASYMAQMKAEDEDEFHDNGDDDEELIAASGNPSGQAHVEMRYVIHIFAIYLWANVFIWQILAIPHNLNHLARFVNQPLFPFAFCPFLFHHYHPDSEQAPANIKDLPSFEGEINVYHSANATTYYADFFNPGLTKSRILNEWFDDGCPSVSHEKLGMRMQLWYF